MNLGEKIKKIRILRKKTQKELAGDKITRNMLSQIESGKARPNERIPKKNTAGEKFNPGILKPVISCQSKEGRNVMI